MKTISEFRKEYPQYNDVSDQDLARTLHQKYYSDIDANEFNRQFLAQPVAPQSGLMPALGAGVDKLQEIGYRAVKGFTDVGVNPNEPGNDTALARAIGQGGALSRWADEGMRRNIEEQGAYTPSVSSYKDIDSLGDAADYVGEITAQSIPMMAAALNPAALFAMGGGLSNEAYEAQEEKQPMRAVLSGFGQAALERLGVETAVGRVLGGEGKNLVKRVGQSALGEGLTETGQEALAQWGSGKSIDEIEGLDEAFVSGFAAGGTIRGGVEAGKYGYEQYRGEAKPEVSEYEETDLTQDAGIDPFAHVTPESDVRTNDSEITVIPGDTSQDWQPNWQFGQNDMPYRGQMQPYTYEGDYEQYREQPNSVPVGAALDAPVIDGEFNRPRALPNRADTIIAQDGRPLQQAQSAANDIAESAQRGLPERDVIYAGTNTNPVNENTAGDAYWQRQQEAAGQAVNRKRLEREAQEFTGNPQLPQKDIIFAEDGRNVQLKLDNTPFGGRRAVEISKGFKQAKADGLSPRVVKVNGGYGWITEGQSRQSNIEPKAEPETTPQIEARAAVKKDAPKKPTAKVYTPGGRELDVEYAIVDAGQLVTSNLDDGRVNQDYPQLLQPRDRTRASSEIQINSIANNINPALLGESATTGDGAPIISDAGVVESGNGRSLALKRAYQQGKAGKYRNSLIEQGYDVSGVEQPVLVRVRRSQLSDDELIAYTKESNERSTLSLSASELAQADAKAVDSIIADYKGGDVSAAANRDFVRKFMQGAVSQTEQASMIDSKGILSQDGRRRIEAAMISSAYGDATLVNDLFESSDNDIKSIGGALLDASGDWAKMRSSAKAGATQDNVDITPNVIEAVNLVRRSRAEGKKLGELVSQTDIFAGDIDPVTKMVIGLFYGGDNYTKPRSRQRVSQAIAKYAELAGSTQGGDSLFGGELESVSPDQLLNKANEANEQTEQQAKQQTSLFDSRPEDAGAGSERSRGARERSEASGNGESGNQPQTKKPEGAMSSKVPANKKGLHRYANNEFEIMDISPIDKSVRRAINELGNTKSKGSYLVVSNGAHSHTIQSGSLEQNVEKFIEFRSRMSSEGVRNSEIGTPIVVDAESGDILYRISPNLRIWKPVVDDPMVSKLRDWENYADIKLNKDGTFKIQKNVTQSKVETSNTARHIEAEANKAATSPTNNLPEPSQAQKEAGNYKKGRVKLHGLDIAIENPKGSTRTGTDPDGKEWSSKMKHHYGDIKGTTGADGDSIDVFIGDNPDSQKVFVVDQVDPGTGNFDEVKVMMGFDNLEAARKGYLSNYDKNWKGLGEISETTIDEFKAWTQRPRKSKQPFALPKENTTPKKPPLTAHEQRQQFWDRFNKADETLTVADAKAAMDAVLNNETQIKEFIGSHTVPQIKDKFYRGWHDSGMRKDDLVDTSYEQMVTEFGFIASSDGTMTLSGIGRKSRFAGVKQKLDNLTDSQLIENMKARKASVDKAVSERKARLDGMRDPQTLEDFRNATRAGLSDEFTPEQWARYDRLHADERIEEQAKRETKQVSAVEGEVNYQTHETTHSKKGHDIYVVSLADRVERDLYSELNTKAKQLGGYYSSYNKQGAIPGFQFRTEEARAEFLKVIDGESVEKTKVAKDKTSHLQELADRVEERANEVLNADRKTNTAKRAREAGYAIGNAEAELQKAAELRAISDAIQSGTAKYIAKMSNGTERDLLASLWNGLRHNAPKELVETRYDGGMAGGLKWKEGVSPEQKVRFAEYPLARMYPDMVKRVAEQMVNTKGYALAGKKLLSDAQAEMRKNTEGRQRMYLANHKHFAKFREFIKVNAENAYYDEVAKDFNRLQRMGITSTPMLRAALLEYYSIASGAAPAGNGGSAVKQKLALSKFQGQYKENDFFNSTPVVVSHVMEHADIQEGMSVFEPSAGVGSLADAAAAIVGKDNVDTNELASGLREYLSEQGYRPTSSDFLTMSPERTFTFGDVFEAPDGARGIMRGSTRDRVRLVDENGDSVGPTRYYTRSELVGVEKRGIGSGYDRIIMNPPFSKGQEARHVAHAYRFLKPGGRLVAVTSNMAGERSNNTDKQFRQWLDVVAADEYPLPEGAFKEAINSTNVNAKVIVIDKPETDSPDLEPPLFALNSDRVSVSADNVAVSSASAKKVVSRFVAGLSDSAADNVVITSTYDDLPQSIKDAAKAQGAEYQVKGVFHKGKTYVVLDQHSSEVDMETTLFHEVYGHQGISQLFGKDITKKLNALFVLNGGLKGLRDTAKRHNINLDKYIQGIEGTALPQDVKHRILMDELLAHMQQDSKPGIKRLVREIVGMIRNKLRDLGLPLLSKINDSDLYYLLRKARSAVKQSPSKGNINNDESLFRVREEEGSPFNLPEETWKDTAIRLIQDKFNRVKSTQKAIRESGIQTSERADVYGKESLYYGKVEEDFRLLSETYLEPMAEKMAKHGIKQSELDLYLYALHAPERNAYIHSIDENMKSGSGMTDDEARAIVESVDRDIRRRQFYELARSVREMIDSRTQDMFEKGLIDEESFTGYQTNYQFYVPLKGQAKDEGGKPKGTGMGFNIKGRESIAALGRQSKAESPLLHAYLDTQKAIIRGHKNEVGNALLSLIEEAPNPELWSVYTTEGPMERKKGRDGKVVNTPMSKEKMSALASNPQSEWFTTKRGGMEYYIKLDDPVLAMQMKNVGVDNGSRITRALGSVNRFLAMMATSANPEFLVTNLARDVQTAMYNLAAESDVDDGKIKGVEIGKFSASVIRDLPKAFIGIRKVLRDNNTSGEWAGAFSQFRKAGAKTGYFDMKDIETQSADLKKLMELQSKASLVKHRDKALKFIDDYNSAVENAVRLSVYKNAIASGVSQHQAAVLAKNLTVNFNRKGQVGTWLNSLYLFANAGIQGTANFARAIGTFKTVDGKNKLNLAQKAGIAMAGIGFSMAMLNRLIAGEDDDGESYWDKVPDYVKERNFVIMLPGSNEYVTFPMPYGYNIFANLGTAAESLMNGGDVSENAGFLTKATIGSFVPLGMSEGSDALQTTIKSTAPQILKPFVDLDTNTNFFGSAIYNDANVKYGSKKSDAGSGFKGTNDFYKNAAMALNELTGGSEYQSGVIDAHPETIRYLLEYIGSGAGRFVLNTAETAARATKGEFEPTRTPFVRRFYGETNDFGDTNTFYDRLDEVETLQAELDSLKGKERLTFRKENKHLLQLVDDARSTQQRLSRLRKRLDKYKESENDEMIERIESLMESTVDKFNKKYNDTMDKR